MSDKMTDLRVTVTLFGKTTDMTRWFTQLGDALLSPTRDNGSDKAEFRKGGYGGAESRKEQET